MTFKLSEKTFGYSYPYHIGKNSVKNGKDLPVAIAVYNSEEKPYITITAIDESAKRELSIMVAQNVFKGAEAAIKRCCKIPEGVFVDANGEPIVSIDAFIKMADTQIILDIYNEIDKPCDVNPN